MAPPRIFTQAAKRFSTITFAIFRAWRCDLQVTSTIWPSLPATIPPSTKYIAFRTSFPCKVRARIARYGHFPHQVRHLRLARLDRRRFHIRKRSPGGHSDRRTREQQEEKCHDPGGLRYTLLLRGILRARC